MVELLEPRQLLTALVNGGVVNGAIIEPAQVVKYTLVESAPAYVQFDTQQSSTATFKAGFALFNAAPNVVAQWSGSTQAYVTLPAGEYTLEVGASDDISIGTFSIGLEGISPPSPKPLSLKNGGIVNGSISSPLQVREYTFSEKAESKFQLDTIQNVSSSFTGQFTLYNSAGQVRDQWTAGIPHFEDLPGGIYLLKVNAKDYNSTGTYSIGYEGLSPISPNPLPLAIGGVVNGTIAAKLAVNEYTLTESGPARVQIDTLQNNSSTFGASFSLYNPSGTQADGWTGGSVRTENLTKGVYLLKVNAGNYVATGSYSVGIVGLSPFDPKLPSLTLGGVVNGSIGASLVVNEYALTEKKAAEVEIDTTQKTSSTFMADFTIYNSQGNVFNYGWTGLTARTFTLPAGDYMLKVNSENYVSTGSYSIGLQGIAPVSPNAVPLLVGSVVQGTISAALNVREYTLNITVAATVEIKTLAAVSPTFTPYFRLFNSNGTELGSWTGSKTVTATLTTGKYLIEVSASNYLATGGYTIGVSTE